MRELKIKTACGKLKCNACTLKYPPRRDMQNVYSCKAFHRLLEPIGDTFKRLPECLAAEVQE